MLKIHAEEMVAKDLKPGDLFSTVGPEYWGTVASKRSVGERVYMRTDEPCPADQESERVYKITVEVREEATCERRGDD